MKEHFLTFGVIELHLLDTVVIQSKKNAAATITVQLPNEFGFKAEFCIPSFKKEGFLPAVREDKSSANYKEHFDVKINDGFLVIQPKSGMIFVADSENIDDRTVKYINDRLFGPSVFRYTWNKSNFCSFSIKKILYYLGIILKLVIIKSSVFYLRFISYCKIIKNNYLIRNS